MHRLALLLLLSVGLTLPAASLAGGNPAAPSKPAVTKRIWTSEEVEALRARELISLTGQPAPAEPSEDQQASQETPAPRVPRPVRAKDPDWYSEQVAAARAVMEVANTEARLVHREVANARYWEAGINLNKENTGITPASGLEILEARNRAELEKIEALDDQARRRGIPPGALR